MIEAVVLVIGLLGSTIWAIIFLLPWRPWSTREELDAKQVEVDLSDVTVLTPARDEEESIAETIEGINQQGHGIQSIVIDDQSKDRTTEIARKTARIPLEVITGTPLPQGWAGKMWALEQGFSKVETTYTLLLDADITLKPGTVATLKQFMLEQRYDFVSLMASLRMKTFWEKLLIPSFVYFFKLLYPFSWASNSKRKLGVAAGGFILMRTEVLRRIGGFKALQGALIDDCTLASLAKKHQYRTWIGLTHSVVSSRGYDNLKSIWNMVARSAYTQLKYSPVLLAGTTVVMASMFVGPIVLLTAHDMYKNIAAAGLIAMAATYMPTLFYYNRSPLWIFLMPLMGVMYIAMTWTSAIRYYLGRKSEWKGRTYSTKEELPTKHEESQDQEPRNRSAYG